MICDKDRIRTRCRALSIVTCSFAPGLLLLAYSTCFALDDPLMRVVAKRCSVTVTGIAPLRTIDWAGDVRPGEWVEPAPACIAYLISESDIKLIPSAVRTQVIVDSPDNRAATSVRRSLAEAFEAIALPTEEWSPPAITKGDAEVQAGPYRIVYPRESKVAARQPVFAWVGGGERFEVRIYRSGVDDWLWKQEVNGRRQVTLDGKQLEDGQTYIWEVRDLQNPKNVELAVFQTPSSIERRLIEEGIRKVGASCHSAATSSIMCEFALAGLFRREGYLYDAIRVLEAIPPSGEHEAIVKSLLTELRD